MSRMNGTYQVGIRITVYGVPGTLLGWDGFGYAIVRLDGESTVHHWHPSQIEAAQPSLSHCCSAPLHATHNGLAECDTCGEHYRADGTHVAYCIDCGNAHPVAELVTDDAGHVHCEACAESNERIAARQKAQDDYDAACDSWGDVMRESRAGRVWL